MINKLITQLGLRPRQASGLKAGSRAATLRQNAKLLGMSERQFALKTKKMNEAAPAVVAKRR